MYEKIKPWIPSLLLLPVVIYYTSNGGKYTFIDNINLLIHEGGHGIFKIFGGFIYTLGGTITQTAMPAMFVVYYWINKKRGGTQIFLVWLGESLMNVSVYAADARAQKLPLLGGNKVYHDWNYLLRKMDMLEYDTVIGGIFFYSGVLIFILALLIPLFIKKYETAEINLNL